MSIFHFKLSNYKSVKVSREIKRITKIDRQKLQDSIDIFQSELDWTEMWSIEDAQKRLEKGWWFYVIEKKDKYIGWAWFDFPNKKFCNLYVHKDYRNRGYGREFTYARLNECKNQLIENVNMHIHGWNKPTHKIINHIGWTPKIHYTFWTGGYDSTFVIYKFLLEGKIVQPIYIDDRVNHGGYHSNSLVKQRGGDTYPRKSTEIELERMDWLRDKIYNRIPNSKELLLKTLVIDNPIEEDEEISRIVEKYNEWIPDTVVSKGWLPVYTDLVARFQKQFGLEIFWANDHIEGEFYEVFDDSIEDGIMNVDKLPSKYKDLKIFSGLIQPLRTTNKKEMLEEAEQFGFDELLYYTWTCWYPINEEPCGECHVCNERIIECKEITNE